MIPPGSPATRTCPLGSRVAVWLARLDGMGPVAVHVPAEASEIDAIRIPPNDSRHNIMVSFWPSILVGVFIILIGICFLWVDGGGSIFGVDGFIAAPSVCIFMTIDPLSLIGSCCCGPTPHSRRSRFFQRLQQEAEGTLTGNLWIRAWLKTRLKLCRVVKPVPSVLMANTAPGPELSPYLVAPYRVLPDKITPANGFPPSLPAVKLCKVVKVCAVTRPARAETRRRNKPPPINALIILLVVFMFPLFGSWIRSLHPYKRNFRKKGLSRSKRVESEAQIGWERSICLETKVLLRADDWIGVRTGCTGHVRIGARCRGRAQFAWSRKYRCGSVIEFV